jgi:hypothetical protein
MTVRTEAESIRSFIESVSDLDRQLAPKRTADDATPDAISRFLETVARLDAEFRGEGIAVA